MATQIYKSQYTGAQIDEAVKRVLNGEAGGGVVVETDPTVPSWAKQSSKPRYTASEVGAAPEQHSHKDYVKTVNGKAPDANGNVTVSGGGGGSGEPGADGFSPIATVEQTDTGAVISITDKNGTTTATVTNGKDGDSPELGIWGTDDGYVLEITQKGATKTFPIYNGKDGEDGASPVVSVSDITDGHRITITDQSGTKTVDVLNGSDGNGIKSIARTSGTGAAGATDTYTITYTDGTTTTFTVYNGKDGKDGNDAVSPTVAVSKSGKVTTVSITDKDGTKTVTINDGADGKTPVRGTDYWTTADQNAIIEQVIDALGGTPVFGVVDADNNIIISGNLADGTYTLKYEDVDGNVTEIGTVTVGETMPDSGEVELVWTYGVKLDKTTGAEGSGDGYAASQHIELIDGYTYTFNQVTDTSGATYGGANICYYDANGNGLGYELLWDADANEHSMALTPIGGAVTFRIRLYCGGTSLNNPALYNMTYEKTT